MHFSRTVETQRHWRRSGVFIINFKHTSHLFLVFLLIILNKCFGNKSFWHQLARRSSGLTSITSFQSLLKGEGVEIVHIYTYTYIYIYIYIYTYIYIYISQLQVSRMFTMIRWIIPIIRSLFTWWPWTYVKLEVVEYIAFIYSYSWINIALFNHWALSIYVILLTIYIFCYFAFPVYLFLIFLNVSVESSFLLNNR